MASEENPVKDSLIEQAARFRARLADAPGDEALRQRIEAWRAQEPAHAQAYEEAERLWALMGSAGARVAARYRLRAWALPSAGIAAALVLMLTMPALERGWQDLRSDAVADIGERRTVTLADGSQVTLDSDTALAFSLDDKGRQVRMFRGEAFFSVTHDPAHPFRIQAGDATVTVLGTRFNVRMDGTRTRVTVEHGRVRLEGPSGQRILTDETQGIYDASRVFAEPAVSADQTAWRHGRAVYYDAPLGEVVADLNRYRRGAIYLARSDLRERRVTGAFRTDTPDQTLGAIRASLHLHAIALAGTVVLY